MKCPLPIHSNLNFESRQELSMHIAENHRELVADPSFVQKVKEIESPVKTDVTKIKEDLTHALPPITDPKIIAGQSVDKNKIIENEHGKLIEYSHENPPAINIIQKINLEYLYTGNCPACKSNVVTTTFEVEDHLFKVAYCEICKKQLETIRVIPIEEQFKQTLQVKKKGVV